MSQSYHIVPESTHNALVKAAYAARGFDKDECAAAARACALAATHGIRTHNAIKALHLDELFGSGADPKGCVPGAEYLEVESKFTGSVIWDANRKLGQAVAFDAMETAMELADKHGIAQVSVDNAFHYLWGGGYVMDAARKGYIAYTNCTSTLAEVVPFMGKTPTLGTNPHSWGFPTTTAIGYPIVIDWATSTIAMGRVEQFKREGKQLPEHSAVDAEGNPTTDPHQVAALLPFGAHKGYGLALINELVAGFIGGSLPVLRGRSNHAPKGEKTCSSFYFQVIHPGAIDACDFVNERSQAANVRAVVEDILGHGNEKCLLPGQIEAKAAADTEKAGGLLFTTAEIEAFNEIARATGQPEWDKDGFHIFES